MALRRYADSFGVPVAQTVRTAVLPEIPARFWPQEEPAIRGQLSLVEETVA